MKIPEYRIVSDYFSKKTNKHCEFVHDLSTLFLKIDGEVYTHRRKANGMYKPEEVIEIFNSQIFGE